MSLLSACGMADDELSGVPFFEEKIRPVLVAHCYECHSAQASTPEAGLLLDSRAGIRQGGQSGPAVVAGDVEASLLISAIRHEQFEMPPDRSLSPAVIENFTTWVKMGAPDPRTGEAPEVSRAERLAAAANFWSFQPVRRPAVPDVADRDSSLRAIDRFILARLQQHQLRPTPPATALVLIRRLYVDLLGLPPSAEVVRRWTARLDRRQEGGAQAGVRHRGLVELVDRLLESPHFGERWGRHWLDLARYADSTGGGASNVLPDAWKYRNYVIRSFNEDKPYDQFVRQQIAGDLLPWSQISQRYEQLVATGFLVMGPRSYITDDEATFRMDGIDEQISTVGQVFLGMTIGCSRCHDHKFDPIPTSDYYALAGIFESTQSDKPVPASKNFTWNTMADPHDDLHGHRLAEYERQTQAQRVLSKQISKLQRAVATAQEAGIVPDEETVESVEVWIADQQQQLAAWQAERAALGPLPNKPATLMAVCCRPAPVDSQLRIRGSPSRLGSVVPRGFLGIVSHAMPGYRQPPQIPADESGRMQLADWLASSENPLTARVLVNRVWHHLFGRGIVASIDNFGTTGQAPSHPELLDWLAWHFMRDGWSVKRLIRRIVLSRTYQASSANQSDDSRLLVAKDPENRLFGRRSRRNLDAETLRDTILAVSGQLDLTPGRRPFADQLTKEYAHQFTSRRRSIYLPRFRNHQLELFRTFDVANPTLAVGRRDQTILPTQALYLMNNQFVIDQSHKAALQLLRSAEMDAGQCIQKMYLRTLSRWPTAGEMQVAHQFLAACNADGAEEPVSVWAAMQQALLECVDFRCVP